MNIEEYASKEIQAMSIEELRILEKTYEEDTKRTRKNYISLDSCIEDKRHPELLKAKYKYEENKNNLSFIRMCLRTKESK